MESLKQMLDRDEKRELGQGRTPPHAVSASTFIAGAIQIEQEQYVSPYVAPIPTDSFYSQARPTLKGA